MTMMSLSGNETMLIHQAEEKIIDGLTTAAKPLEAVRLGALLRQGNTHALSLLRLALQRLVARGVVTYDEDRRYALDVQAA